MSKGRRLPYSPAVFSLGLPVTKGICTFLSKVGFPLDLDLKGARPVSELQKGEITGGLDGLFRNVIGILSIRCFV